MQELLHGRAEEAAKGAGEIAGVNARFFGEDSKADILRITVKNRLPTPLQPPWNSCFGGSVEPRKELDGQRINLFVGSGFIQAAGEQLQG